MATKTAQFIKKLSPAQGWKSNADARLYKLSEPVPFRSIFHPTIVPNSATTYYIVVSVISNNKDNLQEALIFPATAGGTCPFEYLLSLDGSIIGGEPNHEMALNKAGFTLVDQQVPSS